MALSDEDIINVIAQDRIEGIKQLFDRYYRPLVLYANEYLKDQAASEDIVQELFIKLWESDHLLKVIRTSLGIYLYTSIKNRCYSYLHKKNSLYQTEKIDGMDIPVEWVAEVDEECMDLVLKEVEALPNRTRQVVECVMLQGLKYKDVAEQLGISVNTVKFLLKEGMKRLREQLASISFLSLFFFLRHFSKDNY